MGLIRVFLEQNCEGIGLDSLQQGGGGLATAWVHSHVEGAIEFHGKSSGWIVNVHGGNAKVRKDDVGAGALSARAIARIVGGLPCHCRGAGGSLNRRENLGQAGK